MRSSFRSGIHLILLAMMAFPAHSGRATRALAFRKGSTFFVSLSAFPLGANCHSIPSCGSRWTILQLRLNYKINSLPYTGIFAQAAGFKAVWELPTTGGLRVVRSVSDIREHAELVYESHGFDGRSCLLKSICQVLRYAKGQDGVIRKILTLARSYINNSTWHEDVLLCERHAGDCPLQLIGLNSFTESAV